MDFLYDVFACRQVRYGNTAELLTSLQLTLFSIRQAFQVKFDAYEPTISEQDQNFFIKTWIYWVSHDSSHAYSKSQHSRKSEAIVR